MAPTVSLASFGVQQWDSWEWMMKEGRVLSPLGV